MLRPLFSIPSVTRARRFLTLVAPLAPWVFGCAALSIAFLPGEIGGSTSGALAFVGVLIGPTLGTGVSVQPLARRLDDRRAAARRSGRAAGGRWSDRRRGPGAGPRSPLAPARRRPGPRRGLRASPGLRPARDRAALAPPDERGATVAIFYALTYLGFAFPYALGALGGGVPAVLVAIGAMVTSLVVVSVAGRHPLVPERAA